MCSSVGTDTPSHMFKLCSSTYISSDISNRSVLFPLSPKVVLVLSPGSLRLPFLNNLAVYLVSTVFEIAEMK
jgi:hypothetical protein